MSNGEEDAYVLACCPTCGVIHNEESPHSYRYVDNVSFFDEHHLRDPINKEPIFDPVCLAPPCRHTFSRKSIETSLQNRKACPVDESPQTVENIAPAPYIIQSILDKIRVLCPNNCCDKSFPRSLLPRHLLMCPLTLLCCQRGMLKHGVRQSCNQNIRLCDAVSHSAACEYRIFTCKKGCGEQLLSKDLNSHVCKQQDENGTRAVATNVVNTPLSKKRSADNLEPMGTFKWEWGSLGTNNSQFDGPTGIAVASSDKEIFVADMKNNRIQVFTRKGVYLRKWGRLGTGNGQLNNPNNIAISRFNGEVYVSDNGNSRIQVFDRKGNFIRKWGDYGEGDGQFKSCYGIAISRKEEVFVSDSSNDRIQVFDRKGKYLRSFGSHGTEDGMFMGAYGLAMSPNDELYAVDTNNHRVQVFDENGSLMRKFGQQGKSDGEFETPLCISINGVKDRVYVSDNGNKRVQVFSCDGNFVDTIGCSGSGGGKFQCPCSITLSPHNGDVFVGDNVTNLIQVFTG